MSAPFVHRLRVRYAECDPQGVVFNGNYFTYFDVAHTELLRATIGSFDDLLARGLDVVVAEASCRFRAPARFDEELDIAVTLPRLGRTSMTTAHRVDGPEGLVAEGLLRHVFLDRESRAPVELPDWLRGALEPHLA